MKRSIGKRRAATSRPKGELGAITTCVAWPAAGDPAILGFAGDNWSEIVELWRFRVVGVSQPVLAAARRSVERALSLPESKWGLSVRRATADEVREFGWLARHNYVLRHSWRSLVAHRDFKLFRQFRDAGRPLGCFIMDGDPAHVIGVDEGGVMRLLTKEPLDRSGVRRWCIDSGLFIYDSLGALVRAMASAQCFAFPLDYAEAALRPYAGEAPTVPTLTEQQAFAALLVDLRRQGIAKLDREAADRRPPEPAS